MLAKYPNLTVIGHSQPFWSEISADVTEKNRNSYPKGKVIPGRTVELFRKYPNLYGDLSPSAGSGFNGFQGIRNSVINPGEFSTIYVRTTFAHGQHIDYPMADDAVKTKNFRKPMRRFARKKNLRILKECLICEKNR